MGAVLENGKAKVLPYNLEAEQVLLGAILLDNAAMDSVGDYLEPDQLFDPFHKKLYEVMRASIRAGQFIALDTILSKLSMPAHTKVGDTPLKFYLDKLANEGCSLANADAYGQQIRHLAVRRALIGLAGEIEKEAYQAPADANARTQIESVEKRLYTLADTHVPNSGFIVFADTLARTVKLAGDAKARGGGLAGIPTGLRDLDHKMGGLAKTDFIIIAGRPGMGKTALATNIAYHVARTWKGKTLPDGSVETTQGGRVGFFSLEMSAEQLGTRIVADQTGINSSHIRRGDFTDAQFQQIRDVERERNTIPLHIDETGGLNLAQICSRARRLKRQKGLDVLVIDYLQLIAGAAKKNENRTNELTAITSGLKALAKELRVPIIGLSQLSRAVENREDKRPQLSDLRESGSIEQDADVVMFVFREAYYLEQKEPPQGSEEHIKWQSNMDSLHNVADIMIAKCRHGMTGNIPVHFDRTLTRFSDMANADNLPDVGPGNFAPMEGVPF